MLRLEPGEIIANNYRLVRFIDSGGFADVWEAVSMSAGITVALKIYPMLDAEGIRNIEEEYRTQADLSQSHLVAARYFGKHNGYPFLEMRYCAGGNASDRIGKFSERELAKCFYHVASALEYLHEENIVHQDIKPTNILIDAAGNYFLADLGLSLKIRTTIARFTQHKSGQNDKLNVSGHAPPAYRAPELYKRGSVNAEPIKASDIWALGASMYELITGEVPYGELGGATQLTSNERPELGTDFSRELQYIISSCLAQEPWDRPKAADLADWMRYYVNRNSYNITIPEVDSEPAGGTTNPGGTTPIGGNAGGGSTSGGGGTKPEGGSAIPGGADPEPLKKKDDNNTKKSPVWLIVLGIAAVIVLIFLIVKGINGSRHHITSGSDTSASYYANRTDTTLKDTTTKDTTPKVDTAKKKSPLNTGRQIANSGNAPNPVTPGGSTPSERIKKEVPSEIITSHPNIDTAPENISITEIVRTSQSLKVHFRIHDIGNSKISIYGPDDKSKCFFVRAGGSNYNLVAISRQGENLTAGSSGSIAFTATFEPIPAGIHSIDVIEGTNWDVQGMNYWIFRGVNVN